MLVDDRDTQNCTHPVHHGLQKLPHLCKEIQGKTGKGQEVGLKVERHLLFDRKALISRHSWQVFSTWLGVAGCSGVGVLPMLSTAFEQGLKKSNHHDVSLFATLQHQVAAWYGAMHCMLNTVSDSPVCVFSFHKSSTVYIKMHPDKHEAATYSILPSLVEG
eukprot:1150062-Pelagomonas_calceolata.AAC.2